MQQTNGTCKYVYKSHDTVQVMQSQYPSLQSEKTKRMVPEQCTFQLKPGKESKKSAHTARAVQFWFNICCKSGFPLKATAVINIEKIGLFSKQHKDEELFVSASCLLIQKAPISS